MNTENELDTLKSNLQNIITKSNVEYSRLQELNIMVNDALKRLERLAVEEEQAYINLINHPDYKPMELRNNA